MTIMIIFSNETSMRGFGTVKEVMGYEFKPFEANFNCQVQ